VTFSQRRRHTSWIRYKIGNMNIVMEIYVFKNNQIKSLLIYVIQEKFVSDNQIKSLLIQEKFVSDINKWSKMTQLSVFMLIHRVREYDFAKVFHFSGMGFACTVSQFILWHKYFAFHLRDFSFPGYSYLAYCFFSH
jgi:hypothetical protein